ncbi:MAG TPA: flagellar export chaperone FliS [Spirochaetota bacterium]|nr:flagellar export chaperone FliS [Spirochaetota bacterium]HOM38540.1 flagellar export chaperone FliS [Spirochaetota bacterium]HPQ49080.1 flagellar export chaperone FliS [Spirochaetota bacterium]
MNPYSQYKETQILTASPGKLLLMLYDAAISSMEQALEFINEKGKYDVVNRNLVKAQEIIGELLASLDFKVGGEFAKNMQSLYAYMIKRLIEGNLRKEAEPIKEVLKYMKELRESWEVAVKKVGSDFPKKNNNDSSGLNISG